MIVSHAVGKPSMAGPLTLVVELQLQLSAGEALLVGTTAFQQEGVLFHDHCANVLADMLSDAVDALQPNPDHEEEA